MFKTLQARLQQYMNQELSGVQPGFQKGRGTRDQIANIHKAMDFLKNVYFFVIDYVKTFDCVDHKELWEILEEMGLSDHLACLLRNLYADQASTIRAGH